MMFVRSYIILYVIIHQRYGTDYNSTNLRQNQYIDCILVLPMSSKSNMFDHDDPEKSSFPMRHRRWIVHHKQLYI